MPSRKECFRGLFPTEPAYRWKQIEQALFAPEVAAWNDITTLPKLMRETLTCELPFLSVREIKTFTSKRRDTLKAVLETHDHLRFETVLMRNERDQWTICVSSQVGCAMGCNFCATGTMGLMRSLSADEIMDQYRFWMYRLNEQSKISNEPEARISNIVFMGMGEPLANATAVKDAILTWLTVTDLGPTHITVSTVGLLVPLEKLLADPAWPKVRLAVSVHSAHPETRKKIVPTSLPEFLPKLADWARRYLQTLGNRRHHLTFEYIMLEGINDTPDAATELAAFVHSIGRVKVNVIPYNQVRAKSFITPSHERLDAFKSLLRAQNIDVTQRKTMGDDIAAACGQLVTEKNVE